MGMAGTNQKIMTQSTAGRDGTAEGGRFDLKKRGKGRRSQGTNQKRGAASNGSGAMEERSHESWGEKGILVFKMGPGREKEKRELSD